MLKEVKKKKRGRNRVSPSGSTAAVFLFFFLPNNIRTTSTKGCKIMKEAHLLGRKHLVRIISQELKSVIGRLCHLHTAPILLSGFKVSASCCGCVHTFSLLARYGRGVSCAEFGRFFVFCERSCDCLLPNKKKLLCSAQSWAPSQITKAACPQSPP